MTGRLMFAKKMGVEMNWKAGADDVKCFADKVESGAWKGRVLVGRAAHTRRVERADRPRFHRKGLMNSQARVDRVKDLYRVNFGTFPAHMESNAREYCESHGSAAWPMSASCPSGSSEVCSPMSGGSNAFPISTSGTAN